MQKRTLGATGLEVSQLGYGSMGIRGPRTWGVRVVDDEAAERILHQVLDAGINFIDTAPDYGLSEERIGRFIGARRNEFLLATKCGCDYHQHDDHLEINHHWSKEVVQRNLEKSLSRLQTDRIDVLQFHGGRAEELEQNGLIEQLQQFKAEGTVRCIGISTKLPDIAAHIQLGVFDTFQVPYSCLAPEHDEWIAQAAESGAGIIVRGGIAQGGPDAEIQRPALNEVWDKARLNELLPSGMNRAELILRYTLGHPHCDTTIIGTCNAQHLADNVAAANAGPLPAELQQAIAQRVAAVTC